MEAQHHHIPSLIMTWIGYLWMGFLFIWLWLALAADGYHLTVAIFQRLFGVDWTHLMLSRRQNLSLTCLLALGLMSYGVYAAQQIRSEQITLRSAKLAPDTGRIRIVQISDLHLGQMRFPGQLDRLAGLIEKARPDVLVSTGDLIDSRIYAASQVSQQFQSLKAPLGKFAVTGNHEVYAGLQEALDFTTSAGFTLLRGQSRPLAGGVTISGVDDPAVGKPAGADEVSLLAALPAGDFNILLKHQPISRPASDRRFDLQLSGHTHQGQIYPFSIIVKMVYPMLAGLYEPGEKSYLYVSRGTGSWGPPVRLLAPPELTIIDLMPSAPRTATAAAGKLKK